MVRYCKEDLRLASVSIVSNGSLIDRQWMQKFGPYLDILAISCDSFDPVVLRSTGRCTKTGDTDHIEQTKQVRDWCKEFGVVFKMNTVVTARNAHEDITAHIRLLQPKRWKVFQVLPIEGENVGANPTSRDASALEVTQEAFDAYITRHRADEAVAKVLVPEDNAHMRDSYLILDQRMRFLDCTGGKKVPGASILDSGGVEFALRQAGHDVAMFRERGGLYEWRKDKLLDLEDVGMPLPSGFQA
jgi:radical S-adenosyl methionine domain-containing protein 2